MEPSQAKRVTAEAHVTRTSSEPRDDAGALEEIDLRERAERARDLMADLRERAEMALHERPYLLPVATGALGLGVGVLIGSRLSRLLLFTAAGALLNETVRRQVATISRDFLRDVGKNLETIEGVGSEDIESR